MRERIKTIILSLLIVSSMILTFRIWFSHELWPYGYNFFVMSSNNVLPDFMSIFKWNQDTANTFDDIALTAPLSITFNEYGKRVVLNNDKPIFYDIDKYVESIVKVWLNSKKDAPVTALSKEDWLNAIKSKSIYIDFGIAYKSNAFVSLFNLPESTIKNNVKSIKDFIILPQDNITNSLKIIVREGTSFENVQSYSIPFDLAGFNKIISDSIKSIKNTNSSYAFEINFDKPSASGVGSEIIFDSMVLINLEPIAAKKLVRVGDIPLNSSLDDKVWDSIIKSFNMSPNMIQRYTDSNESMFFIDNYATLKVVPNKRIEYSVISTDKGILASKNNEISECLAWSLGFSGNIYSLLGHNQFNNLRFTEIEKEGNNIYINLDYYYNSIPVVFPNQEHAISYKFVNGYLSSYKQNLELFDAVNPIEIKPLIFALNNIYSVAGKDFGGKVDAANLNYLYDFGSNPISPTWNVFYDNRTKQATLNTN